MKRIITTIAILFILYISFLTAQYRSAGSRHTGCEMAVCNQSETTIALAGGQNAGAQTIEFLTSLFDTRHWPARWQCGTWSPLHGWLYILSDITIWFSYFMIPAILGFFVYKKKQISIPFRFIIFLFIVFILACGLTHLIDAIIFWWPAYRLSALVRFFTAVVSLGTVFSLIRIAPRALEFKSPEVLEKTVKDRTIELHDMNTLLQKEVNNRLSAELELLHLNKQLAKKTERLEQINEELTKSEAELKKRKVEVLALNTELEIKVHQRTKELDTINRELEAFTYSVSHDLRAPLRSIHGYTNILFEDFYDSIDEKARYNLDVIRKNALYMGQLIDDLLDFSRTSRTKLVKEYFNAGKEVHSIVDDLLVNEKDRNINIELLTLENCHADVSMLKQVWVNLISNALKYTRKTKAPHITIGSIRQGNEICYYVKDNGVGFDMVYVHKLFEVFQRLHTREDFEGTGVGLALVRRIIEKHGGRIWAEAKLNKGASFYFSLPLK